jgi:hypothetical protein
LSMIGGRSTAPSYLRRAWLPDDGDMTTRLNPNGSPRRSRLLWPIAIAYVR